jgi:hypothetical protein
VSDLIEVRSILACTELSDHDDVRKGTFCLPLGKFNSGGLYRLLKFRDGNSLPGASCDLHLEQSCAKEASVLHVAAAALAGTHTHSGLV